MPDDLHVYEPLIPALDAGRRAVEVEGAHGQLVRSGFSFRLRRGVLLRERSGVLSADQINGNTGSRFTGKTTRTRFGERTRGQEQRKADD